MSSPRASRPHLALSSPPRAVLSGSYRKAPELLRLDFEALREATSGGVISPTSVSIERECSGFVYMRGETRYTPERLELGHLAAIRRADFVWVHAPGGYVGPTTALEIGYARCLGVPVFAGCRLAPSAWSNSVIHVADAGSAARVLDQGRSGCTQRDDRLRTAFRESAVARRDSLSEVDALFAILECGVLIDETFPTQVRDPWALYRPPFVCPSAAQPLV